MLKKIVTGFVLGAVLAGGVQYIAQTEPTFIARTSTGIVQGIKVEGVDAFLGIPYARSPVGDLRWRPPRIAKKWKGVFKADTVPPHCVQSIFGFDRGEEDCLYLNVWTPNLFPKEPLPVMVWIHGGGFTVGHSYETTPGQRLADEGNVIVVSFNYRLGALGYMAHPELTAEKGVMTGGSSGNYGMLDQLAALKWVRRNIRHFGGDNKNVTIFGESAGGMSVCNLLTTPLSKKLFHKAIIQSGPCYSPYPDLAWMEKQGETMEQRLACDNMKDNADDTLACMRSKTSDEILAAMPPAPGMVFGEEDDHWMPNIDGHLFTEQPIASFEAGRFAKVPVINGSNANEGSLLVMFGHEYQFKKLTPELYPERINYLVRDEEKVKKVMAKYPLKDYDDAGDALSALFGDGSFTCHEKWISDLLAKHVPVYSYYFSYPDADFILPAARDLGAFHSADAQFIFGNSMAWLESKFSGGELQLSKNMMGYWTQFSRTGNPNGDKDADNKTGFEWPAYTETQQRLNINLSLSKKSGSDSDEVCEFWEYITSRDFVTLQ